ncbi:hypothetical protein KR51_00022360 [Rubidibacter lacunae KORDI 51-2]|uniref:DUF1232 domain-containing protein n=1 Tax=Rubidibacter lacunae KORDI 51-2 TaxID=582515 RepID=U5D9B3_9CHRO|nr:YkvA family protein [Rubidibacter lacunae]ERN41173.1 hypothetical protein KR51_00022360 [Rubidibacter lacunae KORDI 51-2]
MDSGKSAKLLALEAATSEPQAAAEEGFKAASFLKKVRRVAGYVPFTRDAMAMYYCALDARTPAYAKGVAAAALAYFVLPTDAVPDFIVGMGFTDDASAIAAALGAIGAHINEDHHNRAERFFVEEATTPLEHPD